MKRVFFYFLTVYFEKKTILVTVDINSNFEIKLKDLKSSLNFTSSKIENPEDDLLL